MDNEQNAQCIGRLEHHIHDIFASVRVPGEEFVYNVPSELFNTLDDFCDDQGCYYNNRCKRCNYLSILQGYQSHAHLY